jgi:Asp-tRNA(Asn)/Glu-tRNA(Gln) amidotransferase A subunit family amidase
VVGFKPTHGLISRHGILHQSWILDQVGVFSNCVADAALLADGLIGFDGRDPSMRPFPRPKLKKDFATPLPRPPRIAFTRTPVWNQADEETRLKFTGFLEQLGQDVATVELPKIFGKRSPPKIIMRGFRPQFCRHYRADATSSAVLRETIRSGKTDPAHEYIRAVERFPGSTPPWKPAAGI